MRLLITSTILILLSVSNSYAKDKQTSITIYSKAQAGAVNPDMYRPVKGRNIGWYGGVPGYAQVREVREIELNDKRSKVSVSDVAALIDPTTVSFKSLTDPKGTHVLEQNFLFDLVSQQKLLERFIDEEVVVDTAIGQNIERVKGKLLSTTGGMVLQTEDGIRAINHYQGVSFEKMPKGLKTKPTLVWDILTSDKGDHDAEITYETKGMTWWADYNAIFTPEKNANKGFLDLSSWVSIINQSGSGYEDANLKLIAGDVQRAQPQHHRKSYARGAMMADVAMESQGFTEKSLFEYHLYTLGRKTTLPENSTKQLELFPSVARVPVEKTYIYRGAMERFNGYHQVHNSYQQGNAKVDVFLKLKNEEKIGMGMPLPAGRVRVSQKDTADNTLQFIGEDIISHTPKDEEINLRLGSAFDVKGERRRTTAQHDNKRRYMKETYEITIKNHKDDEVLVRVEEPLFRSRNWKILSNTGKYEKIDSNNIVFPVKVAANGKEKIQYTVEYTW